MSGSVVTIGNFDGVHLGHRTIVRSLLEEGGRRNLPSVAVLFDPHPTVVLGTKVPPRLTTIGERVELLKGLGVGDVRVERFTKELRNTTAEKYLARLQRELGMKFLCVGSTTHIGKGREGTPGRLKELGSLLGFDVRIVPERFEGTEVVSSSRIRRLLEEGEVEAAARFLERPHRTAGTVVAGDGRGRTLGFPTANLESIETLVPGRGVYAVRVTIGGETFPGAANVGYRPTLKEIPKLAVEVHLFDFDRPILGERLEVSWVSRLRDERKFGTVEALRRQIEEDCREARNRLKTELPSHK